MATAAERVADDAALQYRSVALLQITLVTDITYLDVSAAYVHVPTS